MSVLAFAGLPRWALHAVATLTAQGMLNADGLFAALIHLGRVDMSGAPGEKILLEKVNRERRGTAAILAPGL